MENTEIAWQNRFHSEYCTRILRAASAPSVDLRRCSTNWRVYVNIASYLYFSSWSSLTIYDEESAKQPRLRSPMGPEQAGRFWISHMTLPCLIHVTVTFKKQQIDWIWTMPRSGLASVALRRSKVSMVQQAINIQVDWVCGLLYVPWSEG